MVNAKQRTEVVSSLRMRNDRRAGVLTEEGCGCNKGGGDGVGNSGLGQRVQLGAKRTPGNFQPKSGPLNQEHQKALPRRGAGSSSSS